jgi:hypothetical protein
MTPATAVAILEAAKPTRGAKSMSDKELQKQLSELAAKVTALIMLVEALWADELSKEKDPVKFGKIFIDDIFKKDALIREQHGESEIALQISEAITSLIDRAVARAVARRSKGRPT